MAFGLMLPLLADDRLSQSLSSTQTTRFNVAAAGAIHFENSFGEIDIQGWDRPEVEVTTTRSTEHTYGPRQRAAEQQRLDRVQVSTRQDGNDLVISTVYPARSFYLHPLSRRSDIEIHYDVHAPRASKLIIDHNSGGMYISGMDGAVRATVINGQITLLLAPGRYAIDAQCGLGNVYSDFAGQDRSRHLIGRKFSSEAAAPAVNLYLRTRVGDILLLQPSGPAD